MVKTGVGEVPELPPPHSPFWKSPLAPHETAGVLRMQRAGWPGGKIMAMFRLTGTKLMDQIQNELDREGEASRRDVPVYDAQMPKGVK